jgi:hypothetical protein
MQAWPEPLTIRPAQRITTPLGSRFHKPLEGGEARRESGDSPWAVKKTTSRRRQR